MDNKLNRIHVAKILTFGKLIEFLLRHTVSLNFEMISIIAFQQSLSLQMPHPYSGENKDSFISFNLENT